MNTVAHVPTPTGSWPEQLEQAFPARLVDLGAAQVAVRESGPAGAPTLVLLHGISSGAASWLPVVLALPDRLRVIAWDAPGYGASTRLPSATPTAGEYAQRLHQLLDALQVRRCVLAGHSLGALMGAAYAASHGERLARLVLLSPARGYGDQPEQAAKVRSQRIGSLREQGVAGIAARIDERLLSASASAQAREWVRWNAARLDEQGYAQAVELLCGASVAGTPATLPVEVHCGSDDVVTTPASCEQLARQLGVPFHIIASAGHACHAEQPRAVAALLAEAMSRSQEALHA